MNSMTRFLASVSNVNEATSILAAGADIIDIKDPRKGALGAVDAQVTRSIVKNVTGRAMTSATIGDLPMQASCIAHAMDNVNDTGVDIIKVGVFAEAIPAEILQLIEKYTNDSCRIVLVFFADMKPQLEDFSMIADAGVYGVMLDTADKTKGSLRTILDDRILQRFVRQARFHGLLTGLAGSLKAADIIPLLQIRPDYLGFRGALCDQHLRNNTIDMQSACNIRAMIPVVPENVFSSDQLTATI